MRKSVIGFGLAGLLIAAANAGTQVSSPGRGEESQTERKCAVFASAKDRARCACALEQGGWVTKVSGKWRWIYPRRHQERYCHTRV